MISSMKLTRKNDEIVIEPETADEAEKLVTLLGDRVVITKSGCFPTNHSRPLDLARNKVVSA